jgi:protein SCO1/2
MKNLLLIFIAVFLLVSCSQPPTGSEFVATATAKRYELRGTIIAVDKEKNVATVDHQEIPGFMKAMRMDLPIGEPWVWPDLVPGADITAILVNDPANEKHAYWLENIAISAPADPNKLADIKAAEVAALGKQIPDFTLMNQDGKKITRKDFEGKPWAVTFIYAQCPLPEYCIKMSANFSDAANKIASSDLKGQYRLLSISFDPARDNPQALRKYGLGYLGKDSKEDFSTWQLAIGEDEKVKPIADFFGLRYEVDENDKTQFVHSLRTAVMKADGTVTKVFAGSDWTAGDLLMELKKASGN